MIGRLCSQVKFCATSGSVVVQDGPDEGSARAATVGALAGRVLCAPIGQPAGSKPCYKGATPHQRARPFIVDNRLMSWEKLTSTTARFFASISLSPFSTEEPEGRPRRVSGAGAAALALPGWQ